MKPPNNSKNSTNGAKCSQWQGTNQDLNRLKREQNELK